MPENLTFEDYVAVDYKVKTEKEFSENGIIRSLLNCDRNISNSPNEEIDEVSHTCSTLKETKNAIKPREESFRLSIASKVEFWNFQAAV